VWLNIKKGPTGPSPNPSPIGRGVISEIPLKTGSSVKCLDAFRIALTEKPRLFNKQKYSQDCQLSILLSLSNTATFFILILQNVDKALKNHYIIQNKISINKDKNTYKKQFYN